MPESTVVETVWTVKDQQARTALQDLNTRSNTAVRALDSVKKKLSEWGSVHEKAAKGAKGHGKAEAELKEKLRGVGEQGARVKEQLLELAAGVGIAVGIKTLAEKFIELNSETENATRRMGAMLSGMYTFGNAKDPTTNLRYGMEKAQGLMEKFGEASMNLGIPRSELAGMAATLAPAIAQTGKGTKDLVDLTSRLSVLARATGQSFGESAQAMTMAVRFGVAHRSPLMQMLGIHGQILSKMSAAQRLAFIQKRISQFNPEELSKIRTYSDLIGRVRAQVEILTEEAGKPLFDAAKTTVQELGEWIQKNRDNIEQTARTIANKMVNYLHEGVALVKTIAQHWESAKAAVIGIATTWATIKIGSQVSGLAENLSKVMTESGSNFGKASGVAMGMAAKVTMIAEAAAIGWAIGTAIDGVLQQQEWFKKLTTPGMSEQEKKNTAALDTQEAHIREASKALDQATAGGLASKSDLAEMYRQAQNPTLMGSAWADLIEKGVHKTVMLQPGDISRYASQKLGVDITRGGATIKAPKEPPKPREQGLKEVAKTIQDFRYSQFEITQKFNENYDPDRIAVGFANTLGTLGERKLQSGFAPVGSTR